MRKRSDSTCEGTQFVTNHSLLFHVRPTSENLSVYLAIPILKAPCITLVLTTILKTFPAHRMRLTASLFGDCQIYRKITPHSKEFFSFFLTRDDQSIITPWRKKRNGQFWTGSNFDSFFSNPESREEIQRKELRRQKETINCFFA